jgi:hypothetical protein
MAAHAMMEPQKIVDKAGGRRKIRRPKVALNWLCQLPDEIGLQIIVNLTVVDIQVLKQTCRHLMRLCRDPTLEIKYTLYDSAHLEDYLRLRYAETAQLRQTLRRGHLCDGCKALREDPERDFRAWENAQRMLWCSACRCFHPALLYSYRERSKAPTIRVCIGLQGRVRLCRHKTFSWVDLQRFPMVACAHDDHLVEQPPTSSMGAYSYQAPRYALQPFAKHQDKQHQSEIEIVTRTFVSAPGKGESDASATLTAAVRANQMYRCPHTAASAKSQLLKLAPAEFRAVERLPFWDWPKLGYTITRKTVGAVSPRMGTETMFCNVDCCNMTASSRTLASHGAAAALELSLISQTTLKVSSPCSPAWLDALDPKSYLSSKDELTRGIMWCDDPDCPTSFRSIGRHNIFYSCIPLGSYERFHKDCYFPQWTQAKFNRPAPSTKRGPYADMLY